MNRAGASHRFVIAGFGAVLLSAALLQIIFGAQHGERSGLAQLFQEVPTAENLRAWEHQLQESSVLVRALRPWMQAGQFFSLRDAGGKALVGAHGWLFYEPGVVALTQRPRSGEPTARQAADAIVHFRDALAARGIRLILLPAPNKESVYPDQLARAATPPTRIINGETRAALTLCEAAGVEVVDLFALFRDARLRSPLPLYLAQDSHWSPAGVSLAAAALAARIGGQGRVAFDLRPATVPRFGDLVRMLQSTPIETRLALETVECRQVFRRDTGTLYTDDPTSEVLILGDSFLRIYQQDAPGGAGFIAHLAAALGRPVASIVNDGGASTLVRQELYRRPQLLKSARVVVWEFVERDLRLGTEGWQRVPLPP